VGWTISPPSLNRGDPQGARFPDRRRPARCRGGRRCARLPEDYYASLAAHYQTRRDTLVEILERHHFTTYKPSGPYYIMTDISAFGSRRSRVRALTW